MNKKKFIFTVSRRLASILLIAWLSLSSPAIALAQVATETGAPPDTGAPADTGAPGCTGAGCGRGANQGTDQGGLSASDLGADEQGNLLPGVVDTRQGANQGTAQGSAQGSGSDISGTNSNTGAGSNNNADVDANNTSRSSINNSANDSSNVGATANTGGNTQSSNTQADGIKTGNAGIGVTQVKNDNTATVGGASGLNVAGYDGNYTGDLILDFSAALGQLTGAGSSARAVNDTTGSESDNSVNINTQREEITEVQNDGLIDNILDLSAITGQNTADKNTSDGSITTGDANIAATLVNLLNTTVTNGSLWLTVADIFGDLNGNIVLPDLAALAAAAGYGDLAIDVANEQTGANSDNAIAVDINDEEKTAINNEADIKTNVEAKAITGQNETLANTGGGSIATGDGSVSASSVSLANTTIEGGNWGLVVVNALNRWLGFLVGDAGQVRALSQAETIREIEARNSATGENSDNNLAISDSASRQTDINNDAVINNDVTAAAITGQNEASKNTGQGIINTGDANVEVTAVNIANTTVKDGSLFIAVVNIFGDWLGDLLYNNSSLLAGAASNGGTVAVNAANTDTGAESTNDINVDVSREQETNVDNQANIDTFLTADIDTGNNKANRNTLGGNIKTGDGVLSLNSRAVANLTGLLIDPALGLTVNGLNDTTGFASENKIKARLNDARIIAVNNDANISTLFAGLANTGDNEASQNTVGGNITTGLIDADVNIHNLINRVILALSGGQLNDPAVDANLINHLTGALSDNENSVEAIHDLLADIDNRGLIDNLVNLILNTGGNKANENTADSGLVYTGAGCVNGGLDNDANSFIADGLANLSLALNNLAGITNDFNVAAATGGNQALKNTSLRAVNNGGATGRCPDLAVVPEPEITPSPVPGIQPQEENTNESGQGGGGEGDNEGEAKVKVAGVIDNHNPQGGSAAKNGHNFSALKRFPVAGDIGQSIWLSGQNKVPLWAAFLVCSIFLLGVAWHWDRRAVNRKLLSGLA